MLEREQIARAVAEAAAAYPVRRAFLFGSYAAGVATDESDLDLYVEFTEAPISFFKVCGFREAVGRLLSIEVDVVKALPQGMELEDMVLLYEA